MLQNEGGGEIMGLVEILVVIIVWYALNNKLNDIEERIEKFERKVRVKKK